MRSPKWQRDELILALDLYFRFNPLHISKEHEEVKLLSDILNKLPIHDIKPEQNKFRNQNGIYMKLCNFLSCDPEYEGTGLKSVSKLDVIIWNEFSNDINRLHSLANSIRMCANNLKDINSNILDDEELEFQEGRVLYRKHKSIERNSRIIKKVKETAIKKNELKCGICDFDFYDIYGELGKGFIECHHRIPISEYKENMKTSIDDLALVCSNCHRMLHRKRPWLKTIELKSLMNNLNI